MLQEAHYLDLISKYLSGNIQPEEAEELMSWINAQPAHRQLFESLTSVWDLTESYSGPSIDVDVEKAWVKVQHAIQEPQAGGQEAETTPPRNLLFTPRRWWIAAAVLGVLSVAAWRFGFRPTSSSQEPEWVYISGDTTGRKAVTLPDGSLVWLNQHTTISIHPEFAQNRQVRLQGEAFFEVVHQPKYPFTIESKNLITKVLGTSFNVRAYPEESTIEVSVQTGIVQLSAPKDSPSSDVLRVQAGKAAVFNAPQASLELLEAPVSNALAWKEAYLHFDGMPLDEILPILERYFHISTTLRQPELKHCTFHGSFEHPQLEEVLSVLEIALGLDIDQHEGIYVFSGDPCNE